MCPCATAVRVEASTGQLDTILEALRDFGLSDAETSVLAVLLETGARQAGSLARMAGMSRAHVYGVLDRLVGRGLASVHEKRGVRHFSALSLEELCLALEQKEASLAKRRAQLGEVILSFRQTPESLWTDPRTRSYRGAEARARLFQELTREEPDGAVLFCCAHASLVFEESAPTHDSLTQLLHLASSKLRIVIFSHDDSAAKLSQAAASKSVGFICVELPAEMVVSGPRVTLLGKRGEAACCLTIEQPALAKTLQILIRTANFANSSLDGCACNQRDNHHEN